MYPNMWLSRFPGPVTAADQVHMFGAAPAGGGGGCFDPFASSAPAPAPAPVADDSGFGFPDTSAAASGGLSVADRRRQQRESAGTAGFGNVPKGQVNFDAFGSAPAPAPAPAPARAASTSAVNNYQDHYEQSDEESEEEGFDEEDHDQGVRYLPSADWPK